MNLARKSTSNGVSDEISCRIDGTFCVWFESPKGVFNALLI